MKGFFTILLYIFANPARISKRAIARKPYAAGLIILALAVAGSIALGALTARPPFREPFVDLGFRFVARYIFAAAALFLFSGSLHITADMLGGGGSGKALVTLLLIGTAPAILSAPAGLVLSCTTEPCSPVVPWIVKMFMLVWIIGLYVFFIKDVYRFSAWKSLAVMIIPLVITGIALGCIALKVFLTPPAVPIL